MQAILLLPALAALCYGAALPQEWGSPTSISGRPQPTFTIVVPCYPDVPNCTPQTYTIGAADAAEATAIVAREAAPQVLITVSRTVLLPTPAPVSSTKKTTSKSSTKKPSSTSSKKTSTSKTKTHYKRQTLHSPSRTVLLPTPDPPSTTKKPTSTSTTKKPILTSSTKKTSSTSSRKTSKPHWKRQTLGSPSRTVLLPTPDPPSTTKKPTSTSTTKKPTLTSSTKKTSSTSSRKTSKPHWKRQTLGSPSRTVLLPTAEPTTKVTTSSTKKPGYPTPSWPWWHPSPTSIHTVTVTVTQYPTSTIRSTTTQGPDTSRYTTTQGPDTSRYTSTQDASTRTISTTLVVPIDKRQKPPISYTNTNVVTATYTITQTVDPPKPISSTSAYHVPPPPGISSRTVSTTLGITLDKRQELGDPTRTVLLPTTLVSEVIKTTTQYVITTKQTTVKVPTTVSIIKTTTDVIISVSTTTTCTEDDGPDYPITSRVTSSGDASTRTVTATLTVPYEKRQVFGGLPPGFTLPAGVTLIGASPLPTRTYGKRQELGEPSRTFTYVVPTTTGRVVTLYRDI